MTTSPTAERAGARRSGRSWTAKGSSGRRCRRRSAPRRRASGRVRVRGGAPATPGSIALEVVRLRRLAVPVEPDRPLRGIEHETAQCRPQQVVARSELAAGLLEGGRAARRPRCRRAPRRSRPRPLPAGRGNARANAARYSRIDCVPEARDEAPPTTTPERSIALRLQRSVGRGTRRRSGAGARGPARRRSAYSVRYGTCTAGRGDHEDAVRLRRVPASGLRRRRVEERVPSRARPRCRRARRTLRRSPPPTPSRGTSPRPTTTARRQPRSR